MSKMRLYVAGALAVAGAVLFLSQKQRPASDAGVTAEAAAGALPVMASSAAPSAVSSPDAATRGPQSPTEKFSDWAERYAAADAAQRALMTAEGVELALARRPEMLRLIKEDPERALREALPYALRRHLPAEIQALIEQPVNAEGVYTVKVFCDPEHKHEGPLPPPEREFKTDGKRYQAHVYGWRESQFSKSSIALNGVALEDQFAVSADSVRLLDAFEAADVRASGRATGADACAMCGDASGKLSLVEVTTGEYAAVNPEHVALMNDAIQHGLTSQCAAGCALHSQLLADGGTMLEKMHKLRDGAYPPQAYSSVAGSTNPPTLVPPGGGARIGQRTLLLIPAQFGDEVSPPVTRDQAENAGRQVGDQFDRFSYGYEQIVTTVTPPVILPQRLHVYDEQGDGRIINDAEAEAMRLGYNPNQYDFVYVITRSIPSANFGGISSGLAFGVGVGLLVHEIGHNNGLGHANNFDNSRPANPAQPNPPLPFDTDSSLGHPDLNGPYVNSLGSPVTGGSGSVEEYGDNWDTMGGGGSDFSASMKNAIGYLPAHLVREVNGSETNRLYAFDQGSVMNGRKYLLNVPRRLVPSAAPGPGGPYRLSHRRAINNNSLRNGVLMQHGTTTTLLLDTTPGSADERDDAPIVLGRTFTDPEAQLHITPTAVGGTGPDSFIDVVIQRGGFPGNNAPVISSLTASALTIPVGGSVDFSVDAADPDGDVLAYHFSYSDGGFGDNQPSHTRTFNTAGSFVVTCEVSDMKGGVDSTHLLVRVGAVTNFNISGRVVDNNGLPVRGVRVHNGIGPVTAAGYRHAFTDARGFYTIPDLAPGSYEVSGFSYRHRTEPLNYNNGTVTLLGADVNNVNLLAREISSVSVSVLSDAAEPSTDGTFRISRTGLATNDLAVLFNVQSTSGAAFTASTGSPVIIPAGQSFVDVMITPSNDNDGDGGKDVTLTLLNQTSYTEVITTLVSNMVVMQTNTIAIPGWERRPRRTDNATAWFQTQAQYVIGNATAVMQVADNDAPDLPSVSVVRANVGVVEGSRNIAAFVFTRTLTPLTAPLTVNFNLTGTATNGVDYLQLPASVTIPAGERFATVPIVPLNNYLVESNRVVQVAIAANPGVYTVSATGVNLRRITIVDDDLPAVAVITPDSVANRTGNNGRFSLVRSGDLTQPLTVNYLVTGSAVSGVDYQALSGTAVIAAGQSFVDVVVAATPTPSSPGAKLVVLTLSDSASYNIRASGEGTVRIADLVPTVALAITGGTPSGSVTFSRTGATDAPLTVFYAVGGTANMNTDYTAIGNSAVIPAGSANVVVPIQVLTDSGREFTANGQNNDRLNEPETVEVVILPDPAYEVGAPSRGIFNLLEADGTQFPQLGFLSSATVAREDVVGLSIPIRIAGNPTNGPAQPVIVNWAVTGGTAVNGVNYGGPLSGQFQFISNAVPTMGFYRDTSQIQYLGIPVFDDGVITGDRTLILTLDYYTAFVTNTNGMVSFYPTNVVIADFTTHTITLKDVNRSVVTISTIAPLAYEEGVSPGRFRLTRTGSTAQPLTVNLFADGTAAPGADYVKIPPQVTIPAGTNVVDVLVTPVDDAPQEHAETVVLRLVETPGIVANGSAMVVIVDNDGTIQFTSVSVTVDEGATNAVVDVIRSGSTNVMASVDYLLTPGTATDGLDYTDTSGTLFFGIGQTVAQITIPIIDDGLVEGPESLLISLLNASGGAPIAGQTSVTLVINDNDSAVDFLSATFSEYENGTNALITLRRTGLTNGMISVDFSTADGTADGSDYTPVMTTVNFAPGETMQTVLVPLLNDTTLESDETVLLSLTNAVNGGIGANASATLTIIEDEAVVEFAAGSQTVIEHAGVVTVEVRRLGGTRHPFSVDLAVMNGTATNALDFQQAAATLGFSGDAIVTLTNGSGQMVFAPGESSKIINVTLLDDMLGEGDETFQLSLVNLVPPGGVPGGTVVPGSQSTNTITITDDEQPGFVDFFYAPVLATNLFSSSGPTAAVTGTVTDATTGLGIGGVAITMGTATTMSAPDGSYTIPNAPVGMTPITANLPGYFAFSETVDVLVVPSNLFNFSISPALAGDAIRLVLSWGADPQDLDSYLETPFVGIPHTIAFTNLGSLTNPPFASLDADTTTGFGPETITITNRFPGTYNYFINRFFGIGTISSNSGARVEVYDATGLITTINVPTNGGSGDFWHVLQLDGGSGAITVINTITTNAPTIQSNLPPSILRPPADVVTDEGATITFDVVAGGAFPFSYQWQRGMVDLPGQTNAVLQLANVLTNDAGAYRVVVTNAFGSVTSSVAQLTVNLGCERGITGGFVNALALFAAENKVVVGGTFDTVNGFSVPGIARLTSSGLLDSFFNPGTGVNGAVNALAVTPDGRVYLGGEFAGVAGNTANRLARLSVNGVFDSGFNVGAGPGGAVYALALQSDGKLLVAGDFTNYAGQAGFSYVVRLNTNGTLDNSFTADVDAKVLALAVQPDGAILIGGCFDMAGGSPRARVARLLPTGALDGSFDPGIGADGAVRAIALQSTGNILIGGALRIYDGVPVGRFARLLPDGSLDGSFLAGAGADAPVNAIAVDPRDKILLGGAFSTVNGQSSRGFARLRSSGDVDGIFKPGTGANGPVFAAIAQADSSLVIGGDFTDVQGVPRTGLARIHGDAKSVVVEVLLSAAQYTVGEADGMVSVGVTRFGNTNAALALQLATLDGTALAGADYTGGPYAVMFGAGVSMATVDIPVADNVTIEGSRGFQVVLTNAPLAVILSPPSSADVTILDDESAVRFTTAAQSVAEGAMAVVTVERLGLTNAPASVDVNVTGGSATPGVDFLYTNVTVNFAPGVTMVSVMIEAVEDFVADGPDTVELSLQNLAGVTAETPAVQTVTINDFVPLPGVLDPQFNPAAPGTDTLVRSLAVQPDGKLLIGGTFSNYNGTPRVHLARLGTNGTLDLAFDPAAGPDGLVTSIGVLADDRIAIAGSFANVNGSLANRAARLMPDGGKDFNFNAPGTLDSAPGTLDVQPDGRVLLGGAFSMPAPRLTRLTMTGSKDGGFATGTGVNGVVHAITRDEAGNVYIAGGFSMVDGRVRNRVARLLPGGALDTNFVPASITNGLVQAIAVQPDGRVLVAGGFSDVGGVARARVARLMPDGSLDAGFDPGAGVGGSVFGMALQPNGRVLLVGDFTTVDGVPCGRVARLESTGALDMTFNAGGAGADATVFSVALRPDGRVALGGSFNTFNGVVRRGIALLFGDGPFTRFESHVVTATEFRATLATQVGTRYVFEASTNLVTWEALATNQAFGSALTFVDPDVASNPNRSYRARVLVP